MTISLLHLNTFFGTYLSQIISCVKNNNFDLLHFQEVAFGDLCPENKNCFEEFKKLGFEGEYAISTKSEDQKKGFGNATLFKNSLKLIDSHVVWLKPYMNVPHFEKSYAPYQPRNALVLQLEKEGKQFYSVNTHLAWGPTPKDEDYKLHQSNILISYLKTLKKPFILSGDFNVVKDTQVVKHFDELGVNLAKNITNTLNPRIHPAKHLFPPGLAVDYIYVSNGVAVKSFEVLVEDVSDHLGLKSTVEIS